MKAIIIVPETNTIFKQDFKADPGGDSLTLQALIGGLYAFEDNLENGDALYSLSGAEMNVDTVAFQIAGLNSTIFGKSIIVGFKKRNGELTSTHFTIRDLKSRITFCSQRHTDALRQRKLHG